MESSGKTFADEDTTEEKAQGRVPARSPSAACGSASCSPRSARRTRSRSPTKRSAARWSSGRASIPGQEQQVWDYYRKNPQALAELRAPIYEDKVVDFMLELANVTEKKVSAKNCTRTTKTRRRGLSCEKRRPSDRTAERLGSENDRLRPRLAEVSFVPGCVRRIICGMVD